jgi:hypothetical protein
MNDTDCVIKANAKVYDVKAGNQGTMVRRVRAKILSQQYGVYTVKFKDKTLKVDFNDIERDSDFKEEEKGDTLPQNTVIPQSTD